MLEGTDGTYEAGLAAAYDDMFLDAFRLDTAGAVAFLRSLAEDRPLLELGVGTGRVAIPLADWGNDVVGIDTSEPMLEILRSKPGSGKVHAGIGDMADFDLGRTFPVIYAVWNTFFSLLTPEAQASCFACVAKHLEPGGAFVMQCFVPDADQFDRDQRLDVESSGPDDLVVDASTHDRETQRVDNVHIQVSGGRVAIAAVKIRYAFVEELDTMAEAAGLTLAERVSDWDRTPFPGPKGNHISVWQKPA
ncbi:MAG: class I SAM-dependent methyltransferase [Actinomycetota bacterium]